MLLGRGAHSKNYCCSRNVGGKVTPGIRPVEKDLVFEFWLRKDSEPRLKVSKKVYLESHRGRRSEP